MFRLVRGLAQIGEDIEAGRFEWRLDLEDVHLNIEARLIELAASGRLDVATMVTRRIALDEINDGFAALKQGKTIPSAIALD